MNSTIWKRVLVASWTSLATCLVSAMTTGELQALIDSAAEGAAVEAAVPGARYEVVGRTLQLPGAKRPVHGQVAVCTGGTADLPVAEEAAQTAAFFGAEVARFYDVGEIGRASCRERV